MSRKKGVYVWFAKPLRIAILEILEKRGGRVSETELKEELKKLYGEASSSVINRVLMQLEIDGLIHVEAVSPKERIIEKMAREKKYLTVGED
mgnify:CR=1 FL=1